MPYILHYERINDLKEFCNRHEIAEGVYFTSITEKKFKVNRISVMFITKLSEKTAAVNAVIPRLLTKNSKDCPTLAALNRRLSELYSATIDYSVRSDGDLQICEIYMLVLSDRFALEGEKILRESLDILIGCIFSPLLENGRFPAESLEIEKQNQMDDNDAEINDKTFYAFVRAYEAAFRGEPAEIRSAGKNEDVARITQDAAMEAYRNMTETMRTEIICTGESDFDGVDRVFADAFGKIRRSPAPEISTVSSRAKTEPVRITENLDVEQSKLVMFFKTSLRKKYPLMIMSNLYGGTETSKLFANVREKMSLCYFCYSRLGYMKGYVSAECGVDKANLEKTEQECLNQLREITDGNFTDEEIDNIKLDITNKIMLSQDTVSGITSRCFSGILYPENALSAEETIALVNSVTREEIIEAAGSLTLDTVYILTPEGESGGTDE